MPARPYAQIDCSLTGSRKIRGLNSHKARWAYICAHLSDFASYSGVFTYPRHMWAHDAQLTPAALDDAIADLVDAGLIEFDDGDDFVRIVGWLHKRSGPENRNRVVSVISDLAGREDIPSAMLCASAAELVVASLKRARSWRDGSPDRGKLYEDLRSFVAETYADHDEVLLRCLREELDGASTWLTAEIGAFFPALSLFPSEPLANPSETLSKHETKTKRDEDETKTKKDKDYTGANFSKFGEEPDQAPGTNVAVLRNREGPLDSTRNSTLALKAIGQKGGVQ